jgi:hypothetical protein
VTYVHIMIKFKQLFSNKPLLSYLAIVVAFSLLFIFVELNNEKLFTNDFLVYFEATNDYYRGNNPYEHAYGLGTGFFKYPPTTLLFFAPYVLFSFAIIKFFHLAVLVVFLALALPLWKGILEEYLGVIKKQFLFLFLAFLVIVIHVTRELHLGNVNLILLFLFVIGAYFISKNNFVLSSLFWAVMIVLKPIMILICIPMLFFGKWKQILYLIAFGTLSFLFPLIVFGWTKNIHLWIDWFSALSAHGEYLTSPQSLQYLVHTYFGVKPSWLYSFLGLGLLISFLYINMKGKEVNNLNYMFFLALFMAFIPNFFVTDSQHFLLSIPLVMFLIYRAFQTRNWKYWMLFSVGMLLFSFDSSDLWGKDLSRWFTQIGILGLGNLVFIVSSQYVWSQLQSENATSHNL